MSDLRESGAIEQDADIVMFIHRPDYYGMAEDPSQVGLTDIIIAKHRNGATGEVPMRFRASEVRFVDENDRALDMNAAFGDGTGEVGSKMNLGGSNDEFIGEETYF